jgi:transcriptional regulator with XRE-family HTH domain
VRNYSLSSSTPGAVPLGALLDNPPGDNAESVGQRIARLRKAKRWTQADLAKKLGVTETSVCYWEQDRSRPRSARLQSLAALLGTAVAALIGPEASPGSNLGDMVARMRAEIAHAAGTTPAKVKIVIEI